MPTYPPARREASAPKNPHEEGLTTYTKVFANELAAAAIKERKTVFPVGSIIVREKLLKADQTQPELVTVMRKREAGFSRKTGDWEYFVLSGDLAKVKERETSGSCSKCHAEAKETDFVFFTNLK